MHSVVNTEAVFDTLFFIGMFNSLQIQAHPEQIDPAILLPSVYIIYESWFNKKLFSVELGFSFRMNELPTSMLIEIEVVTVL